MASGTIQRPVEIFTKLFENNSVSINLGFNNLNSIDVSISGYNIIGGRISGASSVGLRNNVALLGINVNNHPVVYSGNTTTQEGTMSFRFYYVKDSIELT